MLILTIGVLIIGFITVFLSKKANNNSIRVRVLKITICSFIFSLLEYVSLLLSSLEKADTKQTSLYFYNLLEHDVFQGALRENLVLGRYGVTMRIFSEDLFPFPWFNYLNIDGIAILFVLLTTFISPICVLVSWESVVIKTREFYCSLILLELLAIFAFIMSSLFYFYIMFELTIIPLYFMIGIWGGKFKKVKANYYFLLFSLLGSSLVVCSVIILYSTSSFVLLEEMQYAFSLLSLTNQKIVYFSLLIAFLIKIPSFPFYVWLPEAHVEAPTVGSIFLSAIILKLGGYGVFRFVLPLTVPAIYLEYEWFILGTFYISVIVGSCLIFRQVDLKKIIAYSSIVHMNLSMISLFSGSISGIQGAIINFLGHGLVTTLLFTLVGFLYDRYDTRNILYFTGLSSTMPFFSFFFFLSCLANCSFPISLNFVGEFLVFLGIFQFSFFYGFISLISIFLTTIFSFWFSSRMLFGNSSKFILQYIDLTRREFFCVLLPYLAIFLLGMFPNVIIDGLYLSVYYEVFYWQM